MSRSDRPGNKLAGQDPNAASNLALTASSVLPLSTRSPPSCTLTYKVTDVTSAITTRWDGEAAVALPLTVLALTAALLAVAVDDSVLDTAADSKPLEEALSGAFVEAAVAVPAEGAADCEGATDVAEPVEVGIFAGERDDVATAVAETASGLATGTTGGGDADVPEATTNRPTVLRSMAV
jgi:hypothetical protein